MKLTEQQKNLLKSMTENTCQICGRKFNPNELEIHRIKRGSDGGKYVPNNILIVCKECHKELHSGEF